MKHIFSKIIMLTIITAAISCQDFDELAKNPNKPEEVPPSLILNGVLNDLYERPWSMEHRQNQYWACNYNYYGTNEYWSSATLNYATLKNVLKMEEESERFSEDTQKTYQAIGKFLRAYIYFRMTQRVGDLPLNDALKGEEETSPAYDSQKEIFQQIFVWLEESNTELQSVSNIPGDIYYDGNPELYRKALNAFRLRVLISLSKKEDDAELKIKEQFQQIMADPGKYPLLQGNDESMQYVYNGTSNLYPTNPGNRGFDKGRYNMAETYMKLLTDLEDPRVFVVANPAKKKVTDGISPVSFEAFVGAPSGESLGTMSVNAGNGEYSFANQKRYYGTLKGPEPGVQIGYIEQCFNIAEAINRGWITGNAEEFYNKGIIASMEFYGIRDGVVLNVTDPDTDEVLGVVNASVTDYLAQPAVKYVGDSDAGLEQIWKQKYLAFFQNSGQESYFNFRRTGFPNFNVGPGTGNQGAIPKRWSYPISEATNNTANYKSALQNQFGTESDNVNAELWMNE